MKKEDIPFLLSLIGYAAFYTLYVNTSTFSSTLKTIYYFAWLFCLTHCVILYRKKGNAKEKDKEENEGEDSEPLA